MVAELYKLLVFVSGYLGAWFFAMVARVIATGYFLFIPARVLQCSRIYRALYPGRNFLFYLSCVWRQYHNFTRVITDRMLLLNSGDITFSSSGWEHVRDAASRGRGAVIVMSHMGNWDVAAHLFGREGIPLLLFMGAKDREQLEKIQKDSLAGRGIRIVAVGEDGGSPFDIIEGLGFLRRGGLVSLTGDIVWGPRQRTVEAVFFGRRIALPAAPYILAQKTGAPLLFFFAFRKGPRKYDFVIRDPLFIQPGGRSKNSEAVGAAAQKYADILADELAKHPFQWYHFSDFLGGGKI